MGERLHSYTKEQVIRETVSLQKIVTKSDLFISLILHHQDENMHQKRTMPIIESPCQHSDILKITPNNTIGKDINTPTRVNHKGKIYVLGKRKNRPGLIQSGYEKGC